MDTGTEEREQSEPGREDAAEASKRELDRRSGYLGFVAHEVRNPLSTALWTAELLARMSAADRGGARGEKLSAMCLRSLARVRQLVEDHFLCERLDVDGIPLRIEAVGAREALDAVLAHRPAGAPAATAEVDPGLGVDADRVLLERALDAVIAVAGREGAPVHVAARAVEDVAVFVVTGQPSDAAALQDPVKGAASDPTGRALALPAARRIAVALRGELAVTGGEYVLSLPRSKTYTARPDPAAHP